MQEDQNKPQDQSTPPSDNTDDQSHDIPMEEETNSEPESYGDSSESESSDTHHDDSPAESTPLTASDEKPSDESSPETPSEAPEVETPVDSPVPATDKPAEVEAGDGAKKKLLLVEDDIALAAVYRSRFELENFELYEVNDGEHALQAAKEFKPDLILLDAMMPKISGFDVLDILRHTPETANIRVVMLTALSQPKDKERAENLGVDDYLVKSQVVIGDVVERVKHHLGMK